MQTNRVPVERAITNVTPLVIIGAQTCCEILLLYVDAVENRRRPTQNLSSQIIPNQINYQINQLSNVDTSWSLPRLMLFTILTAKLCAVLSAAVPSCSNILSRTTLIIMIILFPLTFISIPHFLFHSFICVRIYMFSHLILLVAPLLLLLVQSEVVRTQHHRLLAYLSTCFSIPPLDDQLNLSSNIGSHLRICTEMSPTNEQSHINTRRCANPACGHHVWSIESPCFDATACNTPNVTSSKIHAVLLRFSGAIAKRLEYVPKPVWFVSAIDQIKQIDWKRVYLNDFVSGTTN